MKKKIYIARSRYVLFKPESKWNKKQSERAKILFFEYPEIENAYELSMNFRSCYEQNDTVEKAKKKVCKVV